MVDDSGESAALGLQTFADTIDRVKVNRGYRFDHDIREIEIGECDLFARKPFVAGVTADMDDNIRFEDVAKVFVKRQVLMMGRKTARGTWRLFERLRLRVETAPALPSGC